MISNSTDEVDFLELKRIKHKLCSCFGQNRSNFLLCIENRFLEKIDADNVIDSIAWCKYRKQAISVCVMNINISRVPYIIRCCYFVLIIEH